MMEDNTIEQCQIIASDQVKSILQNMLCQICKNLPILIFRCNSGASPCNNTYCQCCYLQVMNLAQPE